MLTADDKKAINEIVVDVIKEVLMPTLQLMDEKSDKIIEKVDSLDIKIDEIALNRKDDKRIQRLEKSLTLS